MMLSRVVLPQPQWSEHGHQLARLEVQGNVLEGMDLASVRQGEDHRDVVDGESVHHVLLIPETGRGGAVQWRAAVPILSRNARRPNAPPMPAR